VGISHREAASLPLAGLTAYQALTGSGIKVEGANVCILGGSGGVGSLAIQMAKALGAASVVTTSSNVDFVTALGADEVINYRETNVVEALKGRNLDLVFDCVGGVESWTAAQSGLKKSGGKFVTICGDSAKPGIGMVPGLVNRKFWSNFGFPAYRFLLMDATKQADLIAITGMVEEGKVKPLLDERHFTLDTESVHKLVAAIKSHRTRGKLVMDVVEDPAFAQGKAEFLRGSYAKAAARAGEAVEEPAAAGSASQRPLSYAAVTAGVVATEERAEEKTAEKAPAAASGDALSSE
jgi:NADPH:quinone reductase-like Zn-dependent oxidoreductase